MRFVLLVILVMMVLLLLVVGCTPSPTATPTSPLKQPEPQRPLIGGQISGILNGALVTIRVHTPSGWEARTITRLGSGAWESVVTEASGVDYVVIAEAESYASNPISYTIHLSGTAAYVVREGQVTTQEASNLDFQFVPEHSP